MTNDECSECSERGGHEPWCSIAPVVPPVDMDAPLTAAELAEMRRIVRRRRSY
jgi:hypothetical protein